MNRLMLLFILLSISSCTCDDVQVKESGNIKFSKDLVRDVDIPAILAAKNRLLPEMCDLVPISYIAEVLQVEEGALKKVNSTSDGERPNHRTCFFKWEDPDFPNTGIMMQAMRNPMEDEFPEYIISWMESKRLSGEHTISDDMTHMFKEFDGVGDEGLYNTDVGKYHWRYSDKVIFTLAFNSIHGHQEQIDIATQLAQRMTNEYLGIN